jgi:hypothetical protein
MKGSLQKMCLINHDRCFLSNHAHGARGAVRNASLSVDAMRLLSVASAPTRTLVGLQALKMLFIAQTP